MHAAKKMAEPALLPTEPLPGAPTAFEAGRRISPGAFGPAQLGDPATCAALAATWRQHGLLLVRGLGEISAAQLAGLAAAFGDVERMDATKVCILMRRLLQAGPRGVGEYDNDTRLKRAFNTKKSIVSKQNCRGLNPGHICLDTVEFFALKASFERVCLVCSACGE